MKVLVLLLSLLLCACSSNPIEVPVVVRGPFEKLQPEPHLAIFSLSSKSNDSDTIKAYAITYTQQRDYITYLKKRQQD
jgi:hypothetical protein